MTVAVDYKKTPDLPHQFLTQQNGLLAIKLLCRITRALQKHRGASVACLDGDIKFAPKVLGLQGEIGKYLQVLEQFNRRNAGLLPVNIVEMVFGEWATIVDGWQKDEVVQNYEFHCHLIEVVRKLQRTVINEYLMTPLSDKESAFRQEFEASLVALTNTIETIAKLRGLATHIAEVETRHNDLYMRMVFLLKMVVQETSGLYHLLQDLEGVSSRLSGLNHLALQQTKTQTLVALIQSDIVDSDTVTASPDAIFEQATAIIDIYWKILDQSIALTEDCIYQSFTDG